MKCLEFIQMHGNWPVSKRAAEGPFSDKRVEIYRAEGRPEWGAVAFGSQGGDPDPGCLARNYDRFSRWPKNKNRVMSARFRKGRIFRPLENIKPVVGR